MYGAYKETVITARGGWLPSMRAHPLRLESALFNSFLWIPFDWADYTLTYCIKKTKRCGGSGTEGGQ